MKNVLMTGARLPCAMDLARQLKRSGHRVFIADTSKMHPIGFSNSIENYFIIPSPRFFFDEFVQAIVEIIEREKINLIIPVWEEVLYLSRILDKIPPSCQVFCSPYELVHALHNKWLFIKKQQSLGIKFPRTYLITSNKDIKNLDFSITYILKGCYSRGAQKFITNVTPETHLANVSPKYPWAAQEFLQGERFCSYSVCFEGKVFANSLYPVQYTMDGSSCLAFEQVQNFEIYEWIDNFVKKTGYTGQIAFDFIKTANGDLFAIECNPRSTSGIHLFSNDDHLDQAFFQQNKRVIIAKTGKKKQIATGMFLYGWQDAIKEKYFLKYLWRFFSTRDVIFAIDDIKPFLFEPLVIASYLIKSKKMGKSIPLMVTYDLECDHDLDK